LKNLERPVRITHLLCSGDEETEKMKYAEKFNRQGEARIWLVWEEWFWDSLEFGGECRVHLRLGVKFMYRVKAGLRRRNIR
jgi:hypothetical protein